MNSLILLGDSLFQRAFSQDKDDTGRTIGSLGPRLSELYMRRLDVIDRGFSGYNTRQLLSVVGKRMDIMPKPGLSPSSRKNLVVIFIGANDARLPDTPGGPQQHVPLEEYKKNLREIVAMVHRAFKNVVLVTPPPIDERMTVTADSKKDPQLGDVLRRKAVVTAEYAEAAKAIGQERGVPILDLWSTMIAKTGYKRDTKAHASDELDTEYLDEYGAVIKDSKASRTSHDERRLPGSSLAPVNHELRSYLIDGLHFSRKGYDLFYDELLQIIEAKVPELSPERLPFAVPAWDDESSWNENGQLPVLFNDEQKVLMMSAVLGAVATLGVLVLCGKLP